MDLDKIEGLTDEQKKAIMDLHDSDITVLKQSNEKLLLNTKKKQDEETQASQKKIKADKVEGVKTLDDMKKLLNERDERQTQLEQKILDDEQNRVNVENSRTIGIFVDEFITKNIVDDSLVRGAIKKDISNNLAVRQGKIVEINDSSELTGRTGDQTLLDAKSNSAYSSHLIVSRANGGSATGGTGNDAVNGKTMTRTEYETQPLGTSSQFLRDGGTVV